MQNKPQPTMWSTNKERETVPIPSDAEWPLPDARRTIAGRSKGKRALKHGRYTAEAIARRYEIRELLCAMNALASTTGERV